MANSLSPGREAALKILYAVEKDGAYLNIALVDTLSDLRLDTRDAALCTNIVLGVERNRLFIDNIIENLSTVKLKKYRYGY